MKLDLRSGVPNSIGFMALGTQSLSLPLPRSGCLLHTDLAVLIPVAAGSGSASLTVKVPPGFAASARLQMFNLVTTGGALDIRSTNGLQMTCN